MSLGFRLFSAGYCTNFERITLKSGKFKSIKFPANFALIKHPSEGYILFDTGYSQHFIEETKKFPFNIYKMLTPVYFNEDESAYNQIINKGIDPEEIKYIIISHFHADHIAGLKDFKNCKFICFNKAYYEIKDKTGISALKNAFIPNLLPTDFEKRVIFIDMKQPFYIGNEYSPLTFAYDVFSDRSILAVELTGHAVGQMGIIFENNNNKIFLCADACWSSKAYKDNIPPSSITKLINPKQREYIRNLKKLHMLYKNNNDIKIIPSHCTEALDEFS
jgi:glyoxylase-like metal-dependent hydrolase (beta-lactamase superfamily II)